MLVFTNDDTLCAINFHPSFQIVKLKLKVNLKEKLKNCIKTHIVRFTIDGSMNDH